MPVILTTTHLLCPVRPPENGSRLSELTAWLFSHRGRPQAHRDSALVHPSQRKPSPWDRPFRVQWPARLRAAAPEHHAGFRFIRLVLSTMDRADTAIDREDLPRNMFSRIGNE